MKSVPMMMASILPVNSRIIVINFQRAVNGKSNHFISNASLLKKD